MRCIVGAIGFVLAAASCGPTLETSEVAATAYAVAAPVQAVSNADASDVDGFVGPQVPQALPDAERAALVRWQHAMIKRCDVRDALGTMPVGANDGDLDLAVVAAHLVPGSTVPTLQTTREQLILGEPLLPAETASTASPVGRALMTASLTGGVCTLRLDDTVIYRGILARQVPVQAGLPGEHAATITRTRPGQPPGPIGHGYVAMSATGLWDAMQQALRPDAAVSERVAQALGLAPAQARRLLPPAPKLQLPAAMQLLHNDNIPWFSRATPNIMSTDDDIATLLEGEDVRTRVRLVVRAGLWPGLPKAESSAAAIRPAWLVLEAPVVVRAAKRRDGPEVVQLETPRVAAGFAVDAYTGSRCLQDRAAMLLGNKEGSATVMPALADIAEPCEVFDDPARAQGYTDGVYMDLLPQVLRHVHPGPAVDWRGWDVVLLRLAGDLRRNRQDVAQTLDPREQSPVIGHLSDTLEMTQQALKTYPRLHPQSEAVMHMMGRQALRGSDVGAERSDALFVALDTAFANFPDAARLWVAQLEQRDMMQDETFARVRSLTPEYIRTAQQAGQVAAQTHDAYFIEHVYHNILQVHPTMHSLQTYIDTTRRRHALER